jgi:hypothetical protein
LIKNDQYLVTGCNDRVLHVWKIYINKTLKSNIKSVDLKIEDDNDSDMVFEFIIQIFKYQNKNEHYILIFLYTILIL